MIQAKLSQFVETDSVRGYRDRNTLVEMYCDREMSMQEIADHFDVSISAIHYWCEKHDLDRRPRVACGWDNPRWKPYAQYCMDSDGHMEWRSKFENVRKVASVHRLTAVAEHGLDAVKDKIVHHKNHIPWDNRPDNLEIMSWAEHSRKHQTERVKREWPTED